MFKPRVITALSPLNSQPFVMSNWPKAQFHQLCYGVVRAVQQNIVPCLSQITHSWQSTLFKCCNFSIVRGTFSSSDCFECIFNSCAVQSKHVFVPWLFIDDSPFQSWFQKRLESFKKLWVNSFSEHQLQFLNVFKKVKHVQWTWYSTEVLPRVSGTVTGLWIRLFNHYHSVYHAIDCPESGLIFQI